ncbi:sensor histidine kinase [Thauera linaloolentis]|uniref:Putative alginate biosynthesis protein AlgZ/FimS n=1 Tax=Thauera linaloolentis (strain DSM 12138 / JCM 21573 / CCUG 41526 / CIP 105981 / IAM 15112 / NBRC 102519 / 47Lol) TaxID=1123367 RepID=N6YFT2_THAL4|nr:histidine kinase [Thauera linaloolentis]ENO90350.1 putative alginate biosynthesis protein AlgZ/FimS [Thauera linaloolentis 47Lol = DSM 12138]MCM8564076.1 histidine kinase [Thauera linaloolentis]
MEIIKQKPAPLGAPALPDFRNLGVILRLLLAVNLLALATLLVRVDEGERLFGEAVLMAGRVELPLLLVVLLLYLASPRLRALPPRSALGGLLALVVLAVALSYPLVEGGSLFRRLAWALGAALICLSYFDYRSRRYSPALAEARLQALTARIRPHFLFNSLNGVLGVIRSDPRRAERALEELADLFRVLMRENRELVPLGDEVALCERYVDLERLRLDERLAVRWELPAQGSAERAALLRARVPALLLQPLLENAVYHGIEPSSETGEVCIRIERHGGELRLEVDNPVHDVGRHHEGNRMALDNIRERLMLFFDLEAGLDCECAGGRYRVRIRLPYRSPSP